MEAVNPKPFLNMGHGIQRHLDVVGPLPPSNGYTRLLTCIYRYTRWAEAIPLPNVQVGTIVKAYFSRWFAIFGAPSTVVTDRDSQFESVLFQTLFDFLDCTRIRTTAGHPAANGIVERFHRRLKTALRAAEGPENWLDSLRLTLLSIRATLKSDLDCSAVELVLGTTIRLPGEIIVPTSRSTDILVYRLGQFMRWLSPAPLRTLKTDSYVEKVLDNCLVCSSGVTVCASLWDHHTKDRSVCSHATSRPDGFFAVTRRTWLASTGSRSLLRKSRRTCHEDEMC
ncbi:hypothetical protein SprV_0100064000 [Sparganum proliferum]